MKNLILFSMMTLFFLSSVSAVILYSDLDDGARVYYQSFPKLEGVSNSTLIAVYDPVEQSCRLPNQCEVNDNEYLRMTCMN
jgi:hypothetical protein